MLKINVASWLFIGAGSLMNSHTALVVGIVASSMSGLYFALKTTKEFILPALRRWFAKKADK